MKKRWVLVVIACATLLLLTCGPKLTNTPTPPPTNTSLPAVAPTATPAPTATATVESSEVRTLDDVKKAMLRIEAEGTFISPMGEQISDGGSGSGFIIDPSGIAVTNNHVVSGASLLRVWVAGESEPRNAKVLGVSECSDLAVIDLEGDGYAYLKWYEGEIKVGLAVYAAGFPLGDPEFTLTSGIVSKERANGETGWASVDAVIEHDATINPGNSGGPLVTKEGQVVAVNYASRSDTNQYFAIARDDALKIIEQLRAGQDVDSIGLNPQVLEIDADIFGIWTASVESGSLADRVGIQAGDIILELKDRTVSADGTMADYCDILRSHDLTKDVIDVRVIRLITEQVLEGQINGPTGSGLEVVSSTYTEESTYVYIQDDLEAIVLEVPEEWSEIDGAPFENTDGQVTAASLMASTDLDEFSSYGAPGVYFMAMKSTPGEFDADKILDGVDQSENCTYEGRYDYQDRLYTGRSDLYTDCGDANSTLLMIAAAPETQEFVTFVMIQVLNEKELTAVAQHIFDSFQVVGSLPTSGDGETFVLTIENQSPDPICQLYITSDDLMGDNWLQSGQIDSGDSWTVELPTAEYFIMAQDCEEAIMGVVYDISDNTTMTFGGPGRTISLNVKNELDIDLCGIYISPSTSDQWGENWLGQASMPDGTEWIFYVEPDVYDLLAEDCDGNKVSQADDIPFDEDKIWTISE